MMTKYLLKMFGNYKIEKIEIDRETEHSYWMKSRRFNKKNIYGVLCDSFKEAKQKAVEVAENKYLISKKRTEGLLNDFTEVIKLKEKLDPK